jgi:hypothetical protein
VDDCRYVATLQRQIQVSKARPRAGTTKRPSENGVKGGRALRLMVSW